MQNERIGIVGLGKMGSAVAAGLAADGISVTGFDTAFSPENLRQSLPSLIPASGVRELENECEIIILAVKPQDLPDVCRELQGKKKYISVAAGITTHSLKDFIKGADIKQIARVMPNLAAAVRKSVTGIYAADPELRNIAQFIFLKIGSVALFEKEDSLHAVTALSGSGPAFLFSFIHSIAEGGVLAGIPYEKSLEMATDMILGSAEYLKKSGMHPVALRNAVASPGGTTIAGLEKLESSGFGGAVMNAVKAAADRSRELGK